MKLHELTTTPGSTQRSKRVGRGDGSGMGKTATRGEKGQKSRTGSTIRPFFEGGQIPLFRRLPKRGFKNPDRIEYELVNLSVLNDHFEAGDVVDIDILKQRGLAGKGRDMRLKVLANGELSKALKVTAEKFSAQAKAKIEAAGGSCVELA